MIRFAGGRQLLAVGVAVVLSCCVYRRARTVLATAYNSTPSQTHGHPNEGAWGDRIEPGMRVIAVSSDLEELGLQRGTRVAIEGVAGTWTVMDRMPSHRRNSIDLYMGDDIEAARRFGVKEVVIRW